MNDLSPIDQENPSPELIVAENDVQTLEEYLDALAGNIVGEGVYTEEVTYKAIISRTYQEILVEQGCAFFEVPVQYFLIGEEGPELSDVMVLQYKMELKNRELTALGTVDEEEQSYEGPLEPSIKTVQELITETFKGIVWE